MPAKKRRDSDEFRTFTATIDQLLSVPKSEIMRREQEYREKAAQNPRKRGPKPKSK